MIKTLFLSGLLFSTLLSFENGYASENQKPNQKPISGDSTHHHSICDNITQSLSHLEDEKAKSIITAFCALSDKGDTVYVDKLQVTINVQGGDASYKEKYTYKDNYGTVNKYSSDEYYDEDCPYCKKEGASSTTTHDPAAPEQKDSTKEK